MTFDSLDVTVRPARPGDAPGAVSLLATIYREGLGFVGDGPPNLGALRARLRGTDPARSFHAVAVSTRDAPAEHRGRPIVVGWLELHRLQATRLEHVAMLTIAVAPDHRRRGVGRRLLRAGHQWAARIGVRKISLHVREGNLGAQRLYAAEGYAVEGREAGQIRTSDGFEDNLIMGRFVHASDAMPAGTPYEAAAPAEVPQ